MKRSRINRAIREAGLAFQLAGWALPPEPRWDVTDLGLGDFDRLGLVLINLAEEPEYCEKPMFSLAGQVTPMHTHRKKMEDIICRHGRLTLELWAAHPAECRAGQHVAEHVVAGNAWINAHNVFAYGLPYGGINRSGLGGGVNSPATFYDYLRDQTIARPL